MAKLGKVLTISLVFLVVGMLFIFFENHFYQFVDEDGVLHESLFLPFGVILLLLGGIGVVLDLAIRFANNVKK